MAKNEQSQKNDEAKKPRTEVDEIEQNDQKLDRLLNQVDKIDSELEKQIRLEYEKLVKEAAALGIKPPKVFINQSKLIKDTKAEQLKHLRFSINRLRNRIEKKKNKKTPEEKRKAILEARLSHKVDYMPEQIAQARYELKRMNEGRWRPGIKMPKRRSVYQEIMNT